MQNVVLASSNQGKLAEIEAHLVAINFHLIAQAEFAVPEAEETGLSFVENAILKARNACEHSGLPALADDSGLIVEALNGEPGVISARYAGKQGDAERNNEKLLTKLHDFPESERSAYFYCVMVFLRHVADPTPIICTGEWHGRILETTRGTQGFGYDPLFYVPTHDRTAAELDIAEKNLISHRGQALQKLREQLSIYA